MKRLASSIILCSLLLFCACESAIENGDGSNEKILLVNLDISVALSDVSDALTRTAKYADAANENEKMHMLRIVIVRPDQTVEANRLIDLRAAVSLKHEMERFKVFGNEKKRIYLFVNESTTVTDKNNLPRKLVGFDLGKIEVGGYFPKDDIEELKINLEDDMEQIEGPLPMSERHEYFVNEEPEQSCSLFVTRAAVKFTFHIINNSSKSITFDGLTIEKMAHKEWYIPRAIYGKRDETTGQQEITEYEVPADVGYYVYSTNTSVPNGVTVDASKETVLTPIYLLEGKYTDDMDSRNYSMNISLDNITRKHYFPELQTLPRNTHVVVHITYDEDAKVTCEADVIPYSEVILEPEFGL